MDIDLERFVAAARLINASITPARDAETAVVVVVVADVKTLVEAVRRTSFSSADGNTFMNLLGVHRGRLTDQRIRSRELQMLTSALHRLVAATDRERKIARGQFFGPMSSSEAVKFMRGRRGF